MDELLQQRLNVTPSMERIPDYDPDGDLSGIQALYYDNIPYQGQSTAVFAYFGLPKGVDAAHPVPAVLLIHGGGGHAYACWVKAWNDRGYAALAMDTGGYVPNTRNAGFREGGEDADRWQREPHGPFVRPGYVPGPDNDGMNHADGAVEEQWIFHALCAAIGGHTILRSHPAVDAARVGVTGVSWGGVITSLLVGYDPRFAFAAPIYGSAYLGDGLAEIDEIFTRPAVRRLWLAEDRLDRVNMPVLWLAWNDDCCFAMQSYTLSYRHLAGRLPATRLTVRDRMMHSHAAAWRAPETIAFADSVLGRSAPFPRFATQPEGRMFTARLTVPEGAVAVSARVLYINSPMRYELHDKFGNGERRYMAQQWQTSPCALQGDTVKGCLPDEAAAYYVELHFTIGEQHLITCSEYVTLI